MDQQRFHIALTPQTKEAAIAFVGVLDAQTDELTANLELIQALRRATASAFGIDRRGDAGKIASLVDASKRSIYEGDSGLTNADGRLVPRGRSAPAQEAVS